MAIDTYVRGRIATMLNRKFMPLALKPEDLKDIWPEVAHSASHLNRWNGFTLRPISIAQHQTMVGEIAYARVIARGGSREEARIAKAWGTTHDVTETLGFQDLPAPLKDLLPAYVAEEAKAMRIVCDALGLPYEMPAVVHEVDMEIRIAESRDQRPACDSLGVAAADIPSVPSWSPRYAEKRWLDAFNDVFGTAYTMIEVPECDAGYNLGGAY